MESAANSVADASTANGTSGAPSVVPGISQQVAAPVSVVAPRSTTSAVYQPQSGIQAAITQPLSPVRNITIAPATVGVESIQSTPYGAGALPLFQGAASVTSAPATQPTYLNSMQHNIVPMSSALSSASAYPQATAAQVLVAAPSSSTIANPAANITTTTRAGLASAQQMVPSVDASASTRAPASRPSTTPGSRNSGVSDWDDNSSITCALYV